jgi:putative hydrolase of the HAD superfamily
MRTILFDLDDTLIVELESAEESFIETIVQADQNIDKVEFLKSIRNQARDNWYKLPTIEYCLKIGISSWEGLWADFTGEFEELKILQNLSDRYRFETWHQTLIKFNINNSEIAEKLSLDFKRIRNTKHKLFPETKETLDKLKKTFRLGLITNGAPDLQWKKIIGGNLKQYFDHIAISGEHGYAKPDSRLFDIAINALKSDRADTIMIGDSLIKDIKGAQDCGLRAIWVNRNKNKAEDIKPDYEITDLTKIFTILSTLINSASINALQSKGI